MGHNGQSYATEKLTDRSGFNYTPILAPPHKAQDSSNHLLINTLPRAKSTVRQRKGYYISLRCLE